jgi:hypothetical protein
MFHDASSDANSVSFSINLIKHKLILLKTTLRVDLFRDRGSNYLNGICLVTMYRPFFPLKKAMAEKNDGHEVDIEYYME